MATFVPSIVTSSGEARGDSSAEFVFARSQLPRDTQPLSCTEKRGACIAWFCLLSLVRATLLRAISMAIRRTTVWTTSLTGQGRRTRSIPFGTVRILKHRKLGAGTVTRIPVRIYAFRPAGNASAELAEGIRLGDGVNVIHERVSRWIVLTILGANPAVIAEVVRNPGSAAFSVSPARNRGVLHDCGGFGEGAPDSPRSGYAGMVRGTDV